MGSNRRFPTKSARQWLSSKIACSALSALISPTLTQFGSYDENCVSAYSIEPDRLSQDRAIVRQIVAARLRYSRIAMSRFKAARRQ
jgi:hypothetical protein